MNSILCEFLAESRENLNHLDEKLIEYFRRRELDELNAVFRAVHTIKGTCGFIGLARLNALAHATESVLGQWRDCENCVSDESHKTVLRALDEMRLTIRSLEETGHEPSSDIFPLINELESLAQVPSEFRRDVEDLLSPQTDLLLDREIEEIIDQKAAGSIQEIGKSNAAPLNPVTSEVPESVSTTVSVPSPVNAKEPVVVESSKRGRANDLTIRIGVDVIDNLMNLVGELVLARNQLARAVSLEKKTQLQGPMSVLNRVTAELQDGVMKARMQPVGHLWSSLPRIIRDLSNATGKQIQLETNGSETELDRTLLEAIRDPLTHMIRNSADHGLELPEVRRAQGKPAAGTIRLNAFQEGGHVVISLEDDGAGINVTRVRDKAIQQGLITLTQAERMSEQELMQLIFRPGFSTATAVTALSGRGVGMDVVRTQIEKIGGTVELSSVMGQGTRVRLKIPLTLAIVSSLLISTAGEIFAVPQLGVTEIVRLTPGSPHRIEQIHGNEVLRLRDELLPLTRLCEVLGLENTEGADQYIVMVQAGELRYGLMVHDVLGTEEIVVKPVGSLLKDLSIYQGSTIYGDGRVLLILDVAGIAAESQMAAVACATKVTNERCQTEPRTSLLCFNAGDGRSLSVPLSMVSRLEEIPTRDIEHVGDRTVVKYRGHLLPLMPVDGYSREARKGTTQPVVVFSENGHSMGLMVSEIEDIVPERLEIRLPSEKPGLLGMAVVRDRATDVVDAHYYITRAVPHWYREVGEHSERILLVDDSAFFRQMISIALQTHGYQVHAVSNGNLALELLAKDGPFDAVISDLEMPQCDGFTLASRIRANPAWRHLPLVALTGNSAKSTETFARQAGFDHFQLKFDPVALRTLMNDIFPAPHSLGELSA